MGQIHIPLNLVFSWPLRRLSPFLLSRIILVKIHFMLRLQFELLVAIIKDSHTVYNIWLAFLTEPCIVSLIFYSVDKSMNIMTIRWYHYHCQLGVPLHILTLSNQCWYRVGTHPIDNGNGNTKLLIYSLAGGITDGQHNTEFWENMLRNCYFM